MDSKLVANEQAKLKLEQQQQLQQQQNAVTSNNTNDLPTCKFCRHAHPCWKNAIKGFLQSLGIGIGMKIITSIIQIMISKDKTMKNIVQSLKSLFLKFENLRFPAFLASMTGVMRGTLCLMRYLRKKNDGYNAFVSGFIAGYVSLQTLDKRSWYIWTTFIASRGIEAVYLKYVNNGTYRKRAIHYTIAFMIASFVIAYGYFLEPNILNKSVISLYNSFAYLGTNEKLWHWCAMVNNTKKLAIAGV